LISSAKIYLLFLVYLVLEKLVKGLNLIYF